MQHRQFTTVDDYISDAPEMIQTRLLEIRQTICEALPPGAEERIAYKMPSYWLKGNLIHFSYFKNHIGIYTGSHALKHFAEDLQDYTTSTGGFQVPHTMPIPINLIRSIVLFNLDQLTAGKNDSSKPPQSQWIEAEEMMRGITAKTPLLKSRKWGIDVFTHQGKNVVAWAGFKHFFSIWFYHGVYLTDPDGVLISASEGKTKALRQWRFTAATEMNESRILAYINEAIKNVEKGLVILPEKKEPIAIDGHLKDYLENDSNLHQLFQRLPQGKQREYIEFIQEAKQEATKWKRLEKIKPLILSGKGLHDKYK